MQKLVWMVLLGLAFNAAATEITVDGKLDEPAWTSAEKHSGFSRIQISGGLKIVKAQTEFSVQHSCFPRTSNDTKSRPTTQQKLTIIP